LPSCGLNQSFFVTEFIKRVITCHNHRSNHLNLKYIYHISCKIVKKSNSPRKVCPYDIRKHNVFEIISNFDCRLSHKNRAVKNVSKLSKIYRATFQVSTDGCCFFYQVSFTMRHIKLQWVKGMIFWYFFIEIPNTLVLDKGGGTRKFLML